MIRFNFIQVRVKALHAEADLQFIEDDKLKGLLSYSMHLYKSYSFNSKHNKRVTEFLKQQLIERFEDQQQLPTATQLVHICLHVDTSFIEF